MEKKKVIIKIMNKEYTIKTDLDPARVKKMAELVNKKLEKYSSNNYPLNNSTIAILTSLEFAEEYLQLEEDYHELLKILKGEIKI